MNQAAHRPYPMPAQPWIQAQTWDNLLFAHWPIAPDVMRQIVPASLAIDTFEGSAWIGIVPFGISGIRARFLPSVPGFGGFLELNLRTYVTLNDSAGTDRPGVYFFSLDAAKLWAVIGARVTYHLPYFHARMRLTRDADWFVYSSQRIHRGAPAAEFEARYRPTGTARYFERDTLAYWLTERYCLYAVDARGGVHRGEIHHPQWQLAPAELEISKNTIAAAAPLSLPNDAPLLHFSKRQDVHIWPSVRVKL